MGFQKIESKKFGDSLFSMRGISKKTVKEHLKLYQGYVNKYNEIIENISSLGDKDYEGANQTYSKVRELKLELSFAWGGVINHEIYFSHLGGVWGEPKDKLAKQIKADFGSFENYKKDAKATGISARGWVWTAWNHREQRLFNYLGDSQNAFPIWGAIPIVALDTYEHAYFIDFGINRGGYIDVFFDNMNWKKVEKDFECLAEKCECCDENCS